MKHVLLVAAMVVGAVAGSATSSQAACAHTGFVRDSIDLTAALINPKAPVTGDVDATGCNIGVYFGPKSMGTVNDANIHGANYYGIVNNGGNIQIGSSTIYDIGESPLNGDQHGVGIYFAFGAASKGAIHDNVLWNYQKGGIVVNGTGMRVSVANNTVIGQGPIAFIAQNGIQIGYGAAVDATGNTVIGNSYTGAGQAASGGIIVVGGDCYGGPLTVAAHVTNNIVVGNDIGVWFSNLNGSCQASAAPTQDVASQNILRNNALNNTTGNGPTQGYQAGVSDQGDGDTITSNSVCGIGYTPPGTPAIALFAIDVTSTNSPVVKNNTTCNASGPVTGHAAIITASVGTLAPASAYK